MKDFKPWLLGFSTALMIGFGALSQAATSYTYTYDGPNFTGSTDRVAVSFTTGAPLAPSKSYLAQTDAGVTASSVSVVGPNGPLVNFTLPVTTFQIHTNANGAIDSWFIFGDKNTLSGTAPTMTGTDWQAYTMNTLVFIPGSDIGAATITGNYDYDQATETTFYTSCTGISGCTLAGNGQPYVGNYSGIINPSNTSGSWWNVTTSTVTPPPPSTTVTISGTLPNGTVGVAYVATETATGGTGSYTWSVTGLPSTLKIDPRTGTISGTPKTSAKYSMVVTAKDSAGTIGTASYTLTIARKHS